MSRLHLSRSHLTLGWWLAAWLWVACVITGCGGAQSAVREPTIQEHVEPTGLRVLSIPRPTPNLVRLSLWIDAGTRDADPPQLATISAWAAAKAGGPDVSARALPDATEFWVECAANDTEAAIAQLARALATREIAPTTLAALQEELLERRAHRELTGRQSAEQQAIVAALGVDHAAAFLPFGTADQDAHVTGDKVAAFLADHWGPNRALLVSVGDVRASVLSEAIGMHLSRLVAAKASRAQRHLDLDDTPTRFIVERATSGWSAIAVVGHERGAVVERLAALERRWANLRPQARWMPVRDGALAVVVAATPEPTAAIQHAIEGFTREQDVHERTPLAATPQDLASLAERVGLEFGAPVTEPTAPRADNAALRIGIAATVLDATRASPHDERRAEANVETTRREIQNSIEVTRRAPRLRGEVGQRAAHVVLDNGARIVVQHRHSDMIGIAVRFLGGAVDEHHSTHGRTALLALLSAQACEGLGAGALNIQLRALGATLSPVLDVGSFGLRLTAPVANWRASLDLITRCALHPLLNRRVLRDAQARMLDTFQPHTPHGRAAQLAQHLAHGRPGTIAPRGGVETALLDLDAITRAHKQAAVGARIAVAIVGDVPVSEVLQHAARELEPLGAGALPHVPNADVAGTGVGAWTDDQATPSAVIAFQIATTDADAMGARAFAALFTEELIKVPSVQLTWLDAGAWTTGAWAAVAIQLPLETLEQLQTTVETALRALNTPEGKMRAARLIEHANRAQVRRLSEPWYEAESLSRRALENFHSDPAEQRAARGFDSFVRTRPHYLVSRGHTAASTNNAAERRP